MTSASGITAPSWIICLGCTGGLGHADTQRKDNTHTHTANTLHTYPNINTLTDTPFTPFPYTTPPFIPSTPHSTIPPTHTPGISLGPGRRHSLSQWRSILECRRSSRTHSGGNSPGRGYTGRSSTPGGENEQCGKEEGDEGTQMTLRDV